MELEGVSANEIRKSFLLGIRFDLKLAILSFFPLALFILIVNFRFFNKSIYRKINNIYLTLTYLVISLFYLVDLGYYEYLSMRIDARSRLLQKKIFYNSTHLKPAMLLQLSL
jgi:hypothetical protein